MKLKFFSGIPKIFNYFNNSGEDEEVVIIVLNVVNINGVKDCYEMNAMKLSLVNPKGLPNFC